MTLVGQMIVSAHPVVTLTAKKLGNGDLSVSIVNTETGQTESGFNLDESRVRELIQILQKGLTNG